MSVSTLNNYMISRVVKTLSSYLSKPFQKVKDDFIRVLFGKHFTLLAELISSVLIPSAPEVLRLSLQ